MLQVHPLGNVGYCWLCCRKDNLHQLVLLGMNSLFRSSFLTEEEKATQGVAELDQSLKAICVHIYIVTRYFKDS